jgi:hypothetical protein
MTTTPRCEHWDGAARTYCHTTDDTVRRYLQGPRCLPHAPGNLIAPEPAPTAQPNVNLPDLPSAALAYAEQAKWRIFPLRPGGKEPLTTHGVKDATRDPKQIRAWWTRWPDANIAVACGRDSICCLDIDSKGNARGEHYAAAAQAAGLLDGWIAELSTPSGGRHLWYPGANVSGGAMSKTRDLEFKAVGGYVLLPPSRVIYDNGSDGYYEITARKDEGWPLNWPRLRDFVQPPIEARRPIYQPKPGQRNNYDGLVAAITKQGEGNRNNVLHWAACAAIKQDAPGTVLDAIAAAAVTVGLDERDVWATIRSAARTVTGGQRG